MVENKDSLLRALEQVAELAARGAASNSLVVGALRQAQEALSTLPIAGEGKVKALEWDDRTDGDDRNSYANTSIGRYEAFEFRLKHPSFGEKTFFGWRGHWTNAEQPTESFEAAKAAAQTDYETRILSALISSPGKDGGQEVEGTK